MQWSPDCELLLAKRGIWLIDTVVPVMLEKDVADLCGCHMQGYRGRTKWFSLQLKLA